VSVNNHKYGNEGLVGAVAVEMSDFQVEEGGSVRSGKAADI
jgi:hypothetical protein